MTQPLYFTNALLVLPNEIIDGSLLITDGHIAALEGPAPTDSNRAPEWIGRDVPLSPPMMVS